MELFWSVSFVKVIVSQKKNLKFFLILPILEISAYLSLLIDVGMVDFGSEDDFGRFEWVIGRELDVH